MRKPRSSSSPEASTGGLVLLGLLLDGPRSGYELVQVIERSVGQFWSMTKAHVYAELPRLAESGLARSKRVEQQGAPDKVVFSITEKGREAFRAWIATADLGAPRLHHPLLLKLFFAAEMPAERVATLVAERKQEIRETLTKLDDLMRASRQTGFSPRQWTLRHGTLRLEAELAFLEEVRAHLGLSSERATSDRAEKHRRRPSR